ncbi:hypothetical protein BN12_40048 [Nostocoides japonicum T1-X7]|uniref:HNH nuclease domain-containing protein n=1 Tax=Nostocoides japonicum T1-X7 TaxID=1194083 RepID=A0A077LYU0_9MICO|nr:NUMOD4 motif-containing HNH endonuclease [Tetrasphaera japonica]CCH79078.1 hypothetical protein BN12_40048 [Tetrasphaera japonica T1-X7]
MIRPPYTSIWRPIPGTQRIYWASADGEVWSAHTRRVLRPYTNSKGYLVVGLYAEGVRTRVFVHQAVLAAFHGPCPEGLEACHADDDPLNNVVANLRWDSHDGNLDDKVARRTHCPHGHPVEPRRYCRTCRRLYMRARRARTTTTERVAS